MPHRAIVLACALISIFVSVYKININEIMQNDLVIEHIDNQHCNRREINSFGPEDVVFFNNQYLITATSGALEIWNVFSEDQKNFTDGGIYLIDPRTEESFQLQMLNFPENVKFHAHGIYVRDSLLYAINHAFLYGGERIEIFEIDASKFKARHLSGFILAPSFNGILNDLIVIDEGRYFIATTFHIFTQSEHGPSPNVSKIETALMWGFRLKLTTTYVCSFQTGDCKELHHTKGIMNNGITWNRSKINPVAYIVDTSGRVITAYKIKIDDARVELNYQDRLEMDHMVDNIEYSENQNVIYASLIGKWAEHVTFATYLSNNKKLPLINDKSVTFHSGAAEIKLDNLGSFNRKDAVSIMNFNSLMRAGSGVYRSQNKIVYGSWCDNAFIFCESIY